MNKKDTTPPAIIPYIGVDLDGTLAFYEKWHADGGIGEPIEPMVNRVKDWLAQGLEVKIISARVAKFAPEGQIPEFDEDQLNRVYAWCEKHLGKKIPVQFWKDYAMHALFDDRARRVELNTGRIIG